MAEKDPIKVYDARWETGEFTDAQVRRMFEATYLYGQLLGVDTVTLCRDARLGCARVLDIAIDTAMKMGLRVFARLDPVSTPQSYFTTLYVTQEHPNTMGLTITASHNPAQYIGVKFTVPVVAAIGQDCGPMNGLTKIREIYHSSQQAPAKSGGSLTLLDLSREYIDFSMQQAGVAPGSLSGLSVVLDAFNGSCGSELFRTYQKAGIRVEARRLLPDGAFPTGSPNPTSHGKMNDAVALAAEKNCDVVIGVDGDGDRVVFGDRNGILTAGFAFVPILQACLPADRGGKSIPALYDPKVSPLALAEWGRLGALPVLFRNGHSQIKDYMTRIGALAAAEESGHYYHRITLGKLTISGENSAITTLLFLAAVKKNPGLMKQLWDWSSHLFTTGEFNYQFGDDATRDAALDAVVKHYVQQGATTVTATPDGIDLQGTCLSRGVRLTPGNVGLDDQWISAYLRVATNEKGVVRSYFSTGDAAFGQQVEQQVRTMLSEKFGGKVVE